MRNFTGISPYIVMLLVRMPFHVKEGMDKLSDRLKLMEWGIISSSDLSYIVAKSCALAGFPSLPVIFSTHVSFCPGVRRSRNVVHASLRFLSGCGRFIRAVCL